MGKTKHEIEKRAEGALSGPAPERHATPVLEAVREAHENAVPGLGFLRPDAESFARSPTVSVDYAVMERTSDAVVLPLGADWFDVGSWTTLAELSEQLERDGSGNVTQGDIVLQDAQNVYARSETRRVAALGVKDLVIVDTPDALLVASKDAAQDTKNLVEQRKQDGRDECRYHRKAYRPWGHYDAVHGGDRFQVKPITILPGRQLSLRSHRHRAEHWVVVRGTARVTRGEETLLLSENESTYIPSGMKHRLENAAETPLELIEVQSGDYLGEDDIIRFEDTCGRPGTDAGAGAPSPEESPRVADIQNRRKP